MLLWNVLKITIENYAIFGVDGDAHIFFKLVFTSISFPANLQFNPPSINIHHSFEKPKPWLDPWRVEWRDSILKNKIKFQGEMCANLKKVSMYMAWYAFHETRCIKTISFGEMSNHVEPF